LGCFAVGQKIIPAIIGDCPERIGFPRREAQKDFFFPVLCSPFWR
jgi:hypothetical protein